MMNLLCYYIIKTINLTICEPVYLVAQNYSPTIKALIYGWTLQETCGC